MTEPTRDALHAETLAYLERENKRLATRFGDMPHAKHYAYAAECVKRVPELEAEVAALKAAFNLEAESHGRECDQLTHERNDYQQRMRALGAEVERLRAKAAIVDAMERGEIREMAAADLEGDFRVSVKIGRGSGLRNHYAPTLLAAYAAATREGTDA